MTASLNGDVKSIPIRCMIEVRSGGTSCADGGLDQPDTETFAIVPTNSLFKDVVKTVLQKLGYSPHEAAAAKGAVQIKNWRALDLEQITDDELVSVEDMLGDLANVATLRIRITKRSRSDDVKDKLLLLLVQQSYEFLQSKGCPILKDDLEKVAEGRGEFSITNQSEFDVWYNRLSTKSLEDKIFHSPDRHTVSSALPQPPSLANKTKLRISFSPQEVARLQQWFEIDPHPPKLAMSRYLAELNELQTRNGVKPLDLTNIMYWFKNARAAARKSGRSVTADDLSEDEGHNEKEGSYISVPSLPNSNAVYSIKDPILSAKCEVKSNNGETEQDMEHAAEESDLDEDLSITDNESDSNDVDMTHSLDKNVFSDTMKEDSECTKPDRQIGLTTTCSSPKANTNVANNITHRLPGYPFPYGAFPMAYLQSQINPFYKEWSEKVHSAVVQANTTNTAQQNMALLKTESIKSECELSKAERQKRHRAFIDPVSEIPKLEQWFTKDTHPSHYIIEQICDDLNRGEFRSRYPKLSPKNIQLWFKNHRAKVKRMRVGGGSLNFNGVESPQMKSSSSPRSGLSMAMLEGV
ncbi:homeobox protein dve-1-like [Watersipora subatra]|uniref:homeobox protein dve-1-like n=1 Tax=Watersipora subatra TaxID=2589382 RepID=UPI00355C9C38